MILQYDRSEPDIVLAGLSIWAPAREFPDSQDYWDGNWLNILARVEAPGAHVEAAGPILRIDELAGFQDALSVQYRELTGIAELRCMEPNLAVTVTCNRTGQIGIVVEITPDHMTQRHRFHFECDQTYLGQAISQIDKVLDRFPLRSP